jgi:mannose-6-phosphate isomerase-like protein (cupin superfamily)
MSDTTAEPTRLIVAGLDGQGRSTVVQDGPVAARLDRPGGAFVEELWRQESLPATLADAARRITEVGALAPHAGVSIRKFTLPPTNPDAPPATFEQLEAAFGEGNVTDPADGHLLHRSDSFYVIIGVSGKAYLMLRTGETLVSAGDTLILPGSMHDWRNPFEETATFVTAVFHLAGD